MGLMVALRASLARASLWGLLSPPARLLPRALWPSLAGTPPRVVIFYSVYLILNVLTKICMPPRGCFPDPCPMGAVDSRVTHPIGVGRAATARVLPGLLKTPPSKDLVGGSASSPLLFVVLVLALFCFFRASALPWLTSLALLSVVVSVAQTARAQL